MILILSGSVLYSARVIWNNASGPTPQIKSSWICASFSVVHPASVISSPFTNGVMLILCSRLVNFLNLSNHCLGVNIGFPSDASAFRFGTIFLSAIVPVKIFGLF